MIHDIRWVRLDEARKLPLPTITGLMLGEVGMLAKQPAAVGAERRIKLFKTIHRKLRDHYRDIANELSRSLNESLQATLTAAHLEGVERDARVRELERQLDILRQVIENLDKLRPQATIGRV